MNLTIDPQNLRACMGLWKDALTKNMPMATEFHIHFIKERPTILGNYERTASAWLMVLRSAIPADGDKEAHAALIADIQAFAKWVQEELAEIEKLALQTAIEAGIDELELKEPDVLARFAKFLKPRNGTE